MRKRECARGFAAILVFASVLALAAALPAAAQIYTARAIPFPPPVEDVTYEKIVACGFYPQETRLECIVEIKRANGYNGPIDAPGTFEHVLFCVDWNGNGVFAASEVVGEVTLQMHDESAGNVPPWFYAVFRDIVPPGGPRTDTGLGNTTTTTLGPTYDARAILSWNSAPTGCSFVPTFGNIVNFTIRLDPIR